MALQLQPMKHFACCLILIAACGKGDSKPTPKPVDEVKPAPAPKLEPKVEMREPKVETASEADQLLVANIDDQMMVASDRAVHRASSAAR